MKFLPPWLRCAAIVWLVCAAWFVCLAVGLLGPNAYADDGKGAAPPWHLPRFDGADDPREKPPAGSLEPPPVLDARGLYDLVVTCFPTRSWWQPEIALEARYANDQSSPSGQIVQAAAETSTYAGIVARIPLYSALEVDREREREAMRRSLVAQNVGKIEQLLASRAIARRELSLWRSIEDRSSRRVAAGVAETKEQIDAIARVAGLESTLMTVAADLTAAKLLLVGMCVDRTDVEAAIDQVIEDRQ